MECCLFKKTLTVLTLSLSANAHALDYNSYYSNEFNLNPYKNSTAALQNSPQPWLYDVHFANLADDSEDPIQNEPQEIPEYFQVKETPDWEYLKSQTYTTLGLSVVTLGIMTLLPSSITKWEEDSRDINDLGNKWKNDVSSGPDWDSDEHYLNYVMHPYFGGVYYTAARHAGYDEFQSFLYSAFLSTFFWEYGVEAFAEVPSWQDLFVTPFFGAVTGEYMFEKEQEILADGGEVWGSKYWGDVTLFILNPIGHIDAWSKEMWDGDAQFQFTSSPWANNPDAHSFAIKSGAHQDSVYYGGEIKFTF